MNASPAIDPEHHALYLTIEQHVSACVHARARRSGVNYLQTATIYQLRAQTPAPPTAPLPAEPWMHVHPCSRFVCSDYSCTCAALWCCTTFVRWKCVFFGGGGDSRNPQSSHRLADNLSDSSEDGAASEGIKPSWRNETSCCWSVSIGEDVCSRRVTLQLHSWLQRPALGARDLLVPPGP